MRSLIFLPLLAPAALALAIPSTPSSTVTLSTKYKPVPSSTNLHSRSSGTSPDEVSPVMDGQPNPFAQDSSPEGIGPVMDGQPNPVAQDNSHAERPTVVNGQPVPRAQDTSHAEGHPEVYGQPHPHDHPQHDLDPAAASNPMNRNPVHGRAYSRSLGSAPVDASVDSLGTRSINVSGPGERVSKRSPTQDASKPHHTHDKNPAATWGKAKSRRDDDPGASAGKGIIKMRNKEDDAREEKKEEKEEDREEEASSAASRVKRSDRSVPRTNDVPKPSSGRGNIKIRNKEDDAREGKEEENSGSWGAFGKRSDPNDVSKSSSGRENIKIRNKEDDAREGKEEENAGSWGAFGKRSDASLPRDESTEPYEYEPTVAEEEEMDRESTQGITSVGGTTGSG